MHERRRTFVLQKLKADKIVGQAVLSRDLCVISNAYLPAPTKKNCKFALNYSVTSEAELNAAQLRMRYQIELCMKSM